MCFIVLHSSQPTVSCYFIVNFFRSSGSSKLLLLVGLCCFVVLNGICVLCRLIVIVYFMSGQLVFDKDRAENFLITCDQPVGSDSVTRVKDSTWLDSSHDFWWLGLDSSHVEKKGGSTRVTFFTEWLDSSHSQSHFYKISEFLIDKATSCALKEMSIFCFSNDQDWHKFSVLSV